MENQYINRNGNLTNRGIGYLYKAGCSLDIKITIKSDKDRAGKERQIN